jgi:Formin Homology 2 Domain
LPLCCSQAKAFDKKTSVLAYLAKLVKENDATLLRFQEDLSTVRHAENIVLDSLASDIKNVEVELAKVHATAAEEAARLEAAGELKPFSLSDLKELKTSVYTIENVPHFNKVSHQSGRTPMERFALNSQDALKQASKKIEKLKKKYRRLLLYFGEDDNKPSNEFFGVMRRFIEEFQKACDDVEKMEAAKVSQGHGNICPLDHIVASHKFRLSRTDQRGETERKESRTRKAQVRQGKPARWWIAEQGSGGKLGKTGRG